MDCSEIGIAVVFGAIDWRFESSQSKGDGNKKQEEVEIVVSKKRERK